MDVVIHSYTREQAIEDGVLVDITSIAEDEGFGVPFAVTSAVWTECIEGPPSEIGQDDIGRARDILRRMRARTRLVGDQSEICFSMLVQAYTKREAIKTFKGVIGPGDNLEPVITLMFADED